MVPCPLPWLSSNYGQIKCSWNESQSEEQTRLGHARSVAVAGYKVPGKFRVYLVVEQVPQTLCLWWSSAGCVWPWPRELWMKVGTSSSPCWYMKAEAGDRWALLWPGLCQPSLFSCCLCSTSWRDVSWLKANCCFVVGSLLSSSSLN